MKFGLTKIIFSTIFSFILTKKVTNFCVLQTLAFSHSYPGNKYFFYTLRTVAVFHFYAANSCFILTQTTNVFNFSPDYSCLLFLTIQRPPSLLTRNKLFSYISQTSDVFHFPSDQRCFNIFTQAIDVFHSS